MQIFYDSQKLYLKQVLEGAVPLANLGNMSA